MTYYFFISALVSAIFIRAVTTRLVFVDGKNITLTSLCNSGEVASGNVIIQLNTSVVHNLTVDCVVSNSSNVTLSGSPHNSGAAIINCEHSGSLNFINSCNINLYDITITNCGTANATSRLANNIQLPNPLKNQVMAVLFMNCVDIKIANVIMTDNSGINLVGINVLGNSALDNVAIENVVPLGPTDSNQTSSAALFEFFEMNCSTLLCNNSTNCHNLSRNSLNITNSCFVNNSNTLPEVVLSYFNSYYYYVSFEKAINISIPLVAPGLTVGFLQNDMYSVSVLVSGTSFIRNHGRFGGGLFVAFANPVRNHSITIDNCIFQENSINKEYIETSYGAGILATSLFYGHTRSHNSNHLYLKPQSKALDLLTISNSNFTDNSAVIGACIYLYLFVNSRVVSITLDNVTFSSNRGDVATAMYVEDHLLYEEQSTIHVTMTNITAKSNTLVHATGQYSKPLSNVNGMFVFFNVRNITVDGSSNCFLNNTPGVIGLSRTDVSFNGVFHFINNTTPYNGGAIYLSSGSTMIIENNSSVLFKNNRAGLRGGAVYSDSSEGFAELAAACPIQFNINKPNISVNFSNNTAVYGGDALYATQLYPCGWFPKYGSLMYNEEVSQVYNRNFNFSLSECEVCNCASSSVSSNELTAHDNKLSSACFNVSDRQITSDAHQVCFYNVSTQTCCTNYAISVHPGTKAKLCLMVVDSKKSPVHSVVHFMSSVTTTTTAPKKVNVSVCCTEVEVAFYGVPGKTVNITLRPSIPLYTEGVNLTVNFNNCSVGFTQEKSTESCVCDKVLKQKRFCNESNDLVIPQGAWIGKIGQSLYFKLYCDLAYCKYFDHEIYFDSNTSVCREHRDGVLCGKCMEDYSVVFGSQDCYRCRNYALASIIGYAIVGIIVVFLLSILKLTVDKGIINGVIFFANVVYINHNLLNIANIKVLPGIFNMINLDAPTSVCFYHGMTALAKYAISFIFPMYMWLLVLLVILLIKKFPSVSRVIQSPAQLLATLIYLSYSKLLLISSHILTPIEVLEIAPSKNETITHYRWHHDPNVAYADLWHLVLVAVSLLLFFVILLPFAVILTFPNYSLGFRCVVRFKPIIDSYTAPYKDRWGFWLGLRLLILIFFYFLLTVQQVYSNPKDLLLIILLTVILLTAVQLYFKPYKKKWVNLLDAMFLLNILIGGCILLWMVKDEGGLNTPIRDLKTFVYIFLGVAALEILGILVYHVMMMTSTGQLLIMKMYHLMCCKDTRSLDTFSEYSHQSPRPLSYSEDQPLLEGAEEGPPGFRESLLNYDNLVTPRSHS